jgi:hypothetical protein
MCPCTDYADSHYVFFADFTYYVFIDVSTYYVFAAYNFASRKVLHNPVASLHNPVAIADITHYVFFADFAYYVFIAVFTYYVFAAYGFASRKVIRRQREEREKRESGCAHVHHLQLPCVASSYSAKSSPPQIEPASRAMRPADSSYLCYCTLAINSSVITVLTYLRGASGPDLGPPV